MRLFFIFIIYTFGFVFARDVKFNVQSLNQTDQKVISLNPVGNYQNGYLNNRNTRDDTTTIWLQNFEGDVSDWTLEQGWELTDSESYSPTHSFRIDDDNYDVTTSLISPIISVPPLQSENEILKMNFALLVDLPDFDGSGDNFLEDYYWVDIANVSDVPVYFNQTFSDAYDGQSWWCADAGVGGYMDAWVQVLQSPTINVPAGGTLSAMMKWGIEEYAGAAVGGTCTDGWDAANVRISSDGGATWNLLNGNDPYDFNYGYGWIYNDPEYDCGGSLEQVAAGWGGQSDWHEVTFDLSEYLGMDVVIQFVFGSDPAYSTPDDNSLTGFKVDDITVTDGSGNIVFLDNADDEVYMTPMNGLEYAWEQYFYDYGDITRPGSFGWEEYAPGMPFNGNAQLDISEYAGDDVRVRFTARMDDNDDGGNGDGLYIDDLHIWKVSYNDVPIVDSLEAYGLDNQVVISWDMPSGTSYDNDDITYVDGTFEDAIMMSSGTSIMGQYFDMPYGAEAANANSCEVWGEPGFSGATTLYGFATLAGVPTSDALYSMQINLQEGQWNTLNLDWTFDGDFLLAIEVSTTVGMGIDANSAPGQYSWANLGGWQPWTEVAYEYGLTDGEFGINANVTTVGAVAPVFNVYRNVNGGDYSITFNGNGIEENQYIDNTVQNGNEYCYEITTIYGENEGNPSSPICAIPEAQTIYEISYDDGEIETSVNAGEGNYLCVKFTPNSYPVDLYRVSFYCDDAPAGVGFVNVWDDDGENGMPGTLLVENVPTTFAGDSWTPIPMSAYGVTIDDGSFYVGWWELADTPPVGVDSDNSSENSFIDIGFGDGLQSFGDIFEGAIMIRAEVDSASATSVDIGNESYMQPLSFDLKQNYPNPFNPVTTISFSIFKEGHTEISLYDLGGRKIKSVLNEVLDSGYHSVNINASNMPSGVYLYTINVSSKNGLHLFGKTKKMVLMK